MSYPARAEGLVNKIMMNFNERTKTLLYKNIISHTLFLKGWCWFSVRDELETGKDCYIEPKFFFDHSSASSSSWLGLLNRGSRRAQSHQTAASSHFGILTPTDSSRAPGYIIVLRPPASAVLPLIYTGASLDWRLSRGSIYNTRSMLDWGQLVWIQSCPSPMLVIIITIYISKLYFNCNHFFKSHFFACL